jgi:hypothetical protein
MHKFCSGGGGPIVQYRPWCIGRQCRALSASPAAGCRRSCLLHRVCAPCVAARDVAEGGRCAQACVSGRATCGGRCCGCGLRSAGALAPPACAWQGSGAALGTVLFTWYCAAKPDCRRQEPASCLGYPRAPFLGYGSWSRELAWPRLFRRQLSICGVERCCWRCAAPPCMAPSSGMQAWTHHATQCCHMRLPADRRAPAVIYASTLEQPSLRAGWCHAPHCRVIVKRMKGSNFCPNLFALYPLAYRSQVGQGRPCLPQATLKHGAPLCKPGAWHSCPPARTGRIARCVEGMPTRARTPCGEWCHVRGYKVLFAPGCAADTVARHIVAGLPGVSRLVAVMQLLRLCIVAVVQAVGVVISHGGQMQGAGDCGWGPTV